MGGMIGRAFEIEDDPAIDVLLSQHIKMLPKEVREKLLKGVLITERRAFAHRMEKHRTDLKNYQAQARIEEIRQRLMSEAGLVVQPRSRRPARPIMLVLLPRPRLKRLLADGIESLNRQKAQTERAEIEAAALRATQGNPPLGTPGFAGRR